MFQQPYNIDEISFAFCYHVYYRWHTYAKKSRAELSRLDIDTLNELVEPYSVRALEFNASDIEVCTLASLRPEEPVSAAASKLKGRISKWLRGQLDLEHPTDLLGKGYFACTCGKSTRTAIEQYLDQQADHHGYLRRVCPPVFVGEYPLLSAVEQGLQSKHSTTILQFHIVLSTWCRHGVFTEEAGRAVADGWRALQSEHQFVLRKVSFVPDHVHLAVRVHPLVSPASLVVSLMNAAQQLMWESFPGNVIRAGVERLWQPGSYIGSFGELASPQIREYIRNWEGCQQPT